jgi:cyclopropane fatty-acyl-phospholipid synthase-like methyltransferase
MSKEKAPEFWNAQARSRGPTDFWGQVRRTVRGKSVDETQIAMLLDAVASGLALADDDVLLDLCCGNGALSARFFDRCAGGVGVDFSDYMIGIARHNFERAPERIFVLADIMEFLRAAPDIPRFSKAVCYGAFAYFSPEGTVELLETLRRRFPTVRRCLLGNIPDKALMKAYFDPAAYRPGIENDHSSPVGRWWTTEEIANLAADTGWRAAIRRMPEAYYAAHYRFDAILEPA